MLTLPITKNQLLLLIDQLSQTEKEEILQYLITKKEHYLDPDDTPDEVVIAGIQQGFKEALSGQLIPLAQMWEGIDVE
ncbi:MAG: hypothetical protein M1G31_18925 [Pseudanabaena sp. Salubria-1]|jgi:hypothetical protein|nr:hypothetical protein [Pseudanabaena sp. Salubria-1]